MIGIKISIDSIRKIGEKHDIPIVFCSAYIDRVTERETSQFKSGIFISKPVEESKIQTALSNFLGQGSNTNLILQYSTN